MPDRSATLTATELQGLSLLGSRIASGRGTAFQAIDPADGSRLDPAYYSATPEELNEAARLAAEAFPVYSRLSGKAKAAFLGCIAAHIEEVAEALVARGMQETGLPAARLQG